MNPDLIRWTEDGKAFSYDCKTLRKFPSGLPSLVRIRVEFGCCCRSVSSRRFSYTSFSRHTDRLPKWNRFAVVSISLRVLHPVSFRFVESVGRIINVR
jgi:hypothetical protein